jgi:hypothetical protein
MKPPKVPGRGSGVEMALRYHLHHTERTERLFGMQLDLAMD